MEKFNAAVEKVPLKNPLQSLSSPNIAMENRPQDLVLLRPPSAHIPPNTLSELTPFFLL